MPRQKSTHVDDPRAVGERLKEAREGRPEPAAARLLGLLARVHLADRGRRPDSLAPAPSGARQAAGGERGLPGDGRRGSRPDARRSRPRSRFGSTTSSAEGLYEDCWLRPRLRRERSRRSRGLGHLALRRGELREAVKLFEDALSTGSGRVGAAGARGEPRARVRERGELEPPSRSRALPQAFQGAATPS